MIKYDIMSKYDMMPRDELIQELKAWEAKFDDKIKDQKNELNREKEALKRERGNFKEEIGERLAKEALREVIQHCRMDWIRSKSGICGPLTSVLGFLSVMRKNDNDIHFMYKKHHYEILEKALGKVELEKVLKEMEVSNEQK